MKKFIEFWMLVLFTICIHLITFNGFGQTNSFYQPKNSVGVDSVKIINDSLYIWHHVGGLIKYPPVAGGGVQKSLYELIDECPNVDLDSLNGAETFPIKKGDSTYQLGLGDFANLISGGGGGGGISEAPNDGNTYGRKNTNWEQITEFSDAPNDGNLYGRKNNAWEGVPPAVIDTTFLEVNFDTLSYMVSNAQLIPNHYYRIIDYQTIYDQPISDSTKTADIEYLIVHAVAPNQLSPIAFSEAHPKDIIHYDISYVETVTNHVPTKGKIIYREDMHGNSADFDWRNVLTYVVSDSSQHLMFEGAGVVSAVVLQNQSSIMSTPFGIGQEFPNNWLKGSRVFNVINSVVSNNEIAGDFYEVSNAIIVGNKSTHEINKIANTTLFNNVFTAGVDRVFGGYIMFSNFTGEVSYFSDVSIKDSYFEGEVKGLSSVHFENDSIIDCNVVAINSVTSYELRHGFKDCVIVQDGFGNEFGNITLECVVEYRRILASEHPILFNKDIHKNIFMNQGGEVWYRYYDNTNTLQFVQIP